MPAKRRIAAAFSAKDTAQEQQEIRGKSGRSPAGGKTLNSAAGADAINLAAKWPAARRNQFSGG